MHFNVLFATIFIAATGHSVTSQPFEMGSEPDIVVRGVYAQPLGRQEPQFDSPEILNEERSPLLVGRRLSRKHPLAKRHQHHHHHHYDSSASVDPSPTPTDSAQISENTDQCGSDNDDDDVTTIYTTITSFPAAPTDTPTDTDTTSPSTTDSSSDTESPTTTDSSPAPTLSNGTNAPQTSFGATIVVPAGVDNPCGDPNGVPEPAPTSGPNGDENWLNCGVNTAQGWQPPPIFLSNLIYHDLADVLNEDGNPFAACQPYLQFFENMSQETGVPTIFLASIALQESGCNPTVTGGAGEIGIMQITGEKCPTDGSDCYDAETNIRIGSEYFKNVLDGNNGNLAASMGEYNGWRVGLTVAAANDYSTCAQHNNLDYLEAVFNWYIQGKSPSGDVGIYHNTC